MATPGARVLVLRDVSDPLGRTHTHDPTDSSLEFGLDAETWTTGRQFIGFRDVPPGLHFVHFSAAPSDSTDSSRAMGGNVRSGFFKFVGRSEVVLSVWDATREEAVVQPLLNKEQVRRIGHGIHDLDLRLNRYPRPLTGTEAAYSVFAALWMPRLAAGNVVYGAPAVYDYDNYGNDNDDDNGNDSNEGQLDARLRWVALTSTITPLTLDRLLTPAMQTSREEGIPSFEPLLATEFSVVEQEQAESEYDPGHFYTVSSMTTVTRFSEVDAAIPGLSNGEDNDNTMNDNDTKDRINFTAFNLKASFPPDCTPSQRTKYSQDKTWLLRNILFNGRGLKPIDDHVRGAYGLYGRGSTLDSQVFVALRTLAAGSLSNLLLDADVQPSFATEEDSAQYKSIVSDIRRIVDEPILRPDVSETAKRNTRINAQAEEEYYTLMGVLFSMDTSASGDGMNKLMQRSLTYVELLAELQFAFVTFFVGYIYDGLEQWKQLVFMLLSSDAAVDSDLPLLVMFIRVLVHQLVVLPDDMFQDILTGHRNFLRDGLSVLAQNLLVRTRARVPRAYQIVTDKLFQFIHAKFAWDVVADAEAKLAQEENDSDDNEYAPVIVEL